MVQIPERSDPTLDAVNAALEAEQQPHVSRNIGFGEIGHECSRYLWYKINTNEPEIFDASTLRIFNAGHSAEARMAAELRKVKGITLYTHDPERDNKQYKFDFLDGRLTGRLDGVIVGLLQAPKTPHLWECKDTDKDKFEKLKKLKNKYDDDEKTLIEWNFKYYAQIQIGMLASDLEKTYMTICSQGLREVLTLRIKLNKELAESLVVKAKRIIDTDVPPEKIGDSTWYQCKGCRFFGVCHEGK